MYVRSHGAKITLQILEITVQFIHSTFFFHPDSWDTLDRGAGRRGRRQVTDTWVFRSSCHPNETCRDTRQLHTAIGALQHTNCLPESPFGNEYQL